MVSAVGAGSWYSMPDWQAGQDNSLGSFYSDANSSIASAVSSAASSMVDGTVNLVAQAAAKRIGVTLPGSTTSSTSSTAKTTSTSSSSGGPTSAHTNIDQFLASLNGNQYIPPVTTSSQSGNFDLNASLRNLDQITSGVSGLKAPKAPTGKNFSISSYLMVLDSIQPPPPALVNVTT
jgi:hypothetical protein